MQEFVYAKIYLKLIDCKDMSNVDIYEIANYCIEQYKNSLSHTTKKYDGTEFFAITKGNKVLYSTTPHILKNALQAILVHKHFYQYSQFWNPDYDVEYIDEMGCANGAFLGDGHSLYVITENRPTLKMKFTFNNEVLYECYINNRVQVPFIWKLFNRVKQVETLSEKKLITELFKKDQTILELEKKVDDFSFANHLLEQERDQYKELLDEIKQLITTKQ